MSDPLPTTSEADEFWKWPPFKDKGDSNPEVIHQAVGGALAIWENTEFIWVRLFCHFVEADPSNAAARAFGAISSSQGRMEALTEAAEVYFVLHEVSDDLQSEFVWVKNHFRLARGRRNDIAHATTMGFMFAGEVGTGSGIFLIPAMYGSKKNFAFKQPNGDRFSVLKSKYRLTASDIQIMTSKFGVLQQAMLGFQGRFVTTHPWIDRTFVK